MNRSRSALKWVAFLAVTSLILTIAAAPLFVGAADHLDAPSLGHVSVDGSGNLSVVKNGGQLDINDLYVLISLLPNTFMEKPRFEDRLREESQRVEMPRLLLDRAGHRSAHPNPPSPIAASAGEVRSILWVRVIL